MIKNRYFSPKGGLSPQTELLTGRAVFTETYAVIPKGIMQDIVTSYLSNWNKTLAWILARPLSGFAEKFSQYIIELLPEGGSRFIVIDRKGPGTNLEELWLPEDSIFFIETFT